MPAEPTFVAFLVGAIAAVAGFAAWLVRAGFEDLKKQRDAAMTGWQGQIAATDKLADSVASLTELLRDRRRV